MSLFEVASDGLIPFRAPAGGAATYDHAIEDILWENLEPVLAEPLLRVRRRPSVGGGGPALLALDASGGVVVIHVRATMDRGDLTDCLEYAAWAHGATADELAGLYWRGNTEFWADWRAFAPGAPSPGAPSPGAGRAPRLKLVTTQFAGRTASTFDYLVNSGVPVQVVRASLHEDARGRRLFDVRPQEELRALDPRVDGAPSALAAASAAAPALAAVRVVAGEGASSAHAARATVDLPASAVSRARAGAEPVVVPGAALREHGDPLRGEILPPAELSAEQLRNDPLGVDQIVGGRVTAIEPGTPEPSAYQPEPAAREPFALPAAALTPFGDTPSGGTGSGGTAFAPDASANGLTVPRFDAPSEGGLPRFEATPGQPAAGLDAAPGQPFAIGGGVMRSGGAGAEPVNPAPAASHPAAGAEPGTSAGQSAGSALPAFGAPGPAEPVAAGFQPPAEPAPFQAEPAPFGGVRPSFPDIEPFPPSGSSFVPPAEPAPYSPPPFAAALDQPGHAVQPPPFDEPPGFASPAAAAPGPGPGAPAPFGHAGQSGGPVSAPFGRPDAAPAEPRSPAMGAPFGDHGAASPSVAADAHLLGPTGSASYGRPGESGGLAQFAQSAPLADSGPRFADHTPSSGFGGAQPMPPSGAGAGSAEGGSGQRAEPPSNVIPLGSRQPSTPDAAPASWEPSQPEWDTGSYGGFAGPEFRLPGLPPAPPRDPLTSTNELPPYGSQQHSSQMPPGVTGQSALPAPGSVSAIGDPQLASPQGSISGLSGSAADSAAPTGRAPDGSTGNSAPAINGASPNDSTLSAGPFYAAPFNGTAFDAAPFDGTASHGTPFNGPPFDGTASHGGPFNGAAFDGTASHGAPFNGAAFDGAAFGGPVPSSGASTGASEAPDGVPGSSAVHHGRLPELDAEPPLAPPPFRPGAQQVSGPPRLDFPSADFGRPQEPGPAESWLTGPPPTDPLPRRVPGVFGGGPLPSGSPARGAHADRGPQFANLEPAESQPDAGDRPAEHDEPERHVLRVPDAPTWEPHRANGYPHRENGRNRH